MSLTILGGSLTPVVHDGTTRDAVYGVDAQGVYLGVVNAAQAVQQANGPPPSHGTFRWVGGAWVPFVSWDQRMLKIEAQRDSTLDAGVVWSARTWYSDATFQQQLAAFLQLYSEGILLATDTVGVRAKDKVVYQLGRLDLRALAAAVMTAVQQAYAASWAAKAAAPP